MTKRASIDEETHLSLRHSDQSARVELAALAADDPPLAERELEWEMQDLALRLLYAPIADEPVPTRHKAVIAAAVTRHTGRGQWRQLAAALVFLAVGTAVGWTGATYFDHSTADLSLPQEALRAHATYVVEVAHPVEVRATEEAHLVAWLSKRLGHPISVPNLDAHGYQLIGGRIVPEKNGAAALMMYEDAEGRRITLYIAREPGGQETAFRFVDGNGTRAFWWVDEGFGCAVTGDVSKDTLRAIAVSAYEQLI